MFSVLTVISLFSLDGLCHNLIKMQAATTLIVISIFCGIYFEFLKPFAFDNRSSEQYFEQALTLGQEKKFDQAVVYLRKAIELDPNNKQALFSCKQIYKFHLGDKPDQRKIIEICSYIIKRSPGNIDAYRYLMIAHFESNEVEKALKTMREALKRNPNSAQAHLLSASAFNWIGNDKESVKCVGKAIRIEPENAELYVVRADYQINCSNYDAAELDISKAISLNPDCTNAYRCRCRLYNNIGKIEMESAARDKWLSVAVKMNRMNSLYN